MKTNDIDLLLKKSFSQEFSPSPNLERVTWQKMENPPRKKRGILIMLLSILCYTLLAVETVVVLSYFNYPALNIMFLSFYSSSICFIVLYQIITNNTNLKIEIYE